MAVNAAGDDVQVVQIRRGEMKSAIAGKSGVKGDVDPVEPLVDGA
jgi:hypothetical protein